MERERVTRERWIESKRERRAGGKIRRRRERERRERKRKRERTRKGERVRYI